MIVCAGDSESFDFALPIGIGLTNTAINLTKLCLLNPPTFLLFVGTAGSYGNKKILEISTSSKGSNIEIGYFEKLSYTPIDNVIENDLLNVSRETNQDIIVNSSNYITQDEEQSKKFLHAGLELENMEFFSFLSVAKEFSIPARGVFCVTNYCDKNAHKDFLENHKKAKELLDLHIKKHYGGLGK